MNNNQSVHVCMHKSCIGSKISECVSCGLSGFGPFFTEPQVMTNERSRCKVSALSVPMQH